MKEREILLNAIFFPRKSSRLKDQKDHFVNVDKNINVGIRFFIKDKSIPTILFFHGNAELAQEYDSIAKMYNDFDCNFIVSDYRGYGLSNGTPNKENLHKDSSVIFDYIQKYLDNNNFTSKRIIMGRSLGSASACEILEKHENEIDGCIIESGFGTEIPLMRILGLSPNDLDYDPKFGFENLRKIMNFKKPIFIIHAEMDDIIPIDEAKNMYEKSKSNIKELWSIPNADHNNIMIHTKENYFNRIKKFIDTI